MGSSRNGGMRDAEGLTCNLANSRESGLSSLTSRHIAMTGLVRNRVKRRPHSVSKHTCTKKHCWMPVYGIQGLIMSTYN